MRLTSAFVVSALMRRLFADGDFAAIERKGADQAGAIFLRQRHRDGSETLFGPAPQSVFEGDGEERRFERRILAGSSADVDALIARELRFDPDLWVVEIETGDAARYVTVV